MTSKIELITPAMASEILEHHNPRNRSVSERTVTAYATDMKNGRWTLTHQGLAFDENGDLIDGQHRLWAVFFSDKEIEFLVTRGIPVRQSKGGLEINSMDNIDRGRIRGAGSQMQLCHGIKNGNKVASACRGIAFITSPHERQKRLSFSSSLFIYEQYGKDIESVMASLESRHHVQHILAPLALFHKANPEEALEFARQLTTLEGLTPPVRVAVKWLEGKHSSATPEQTMRVMAKCIHHFHLKTARLERVIDDDTGIKFLLGFFPSLNKRISEQLKPVPGLKLINKSIK